MKNQEILILSVCYSVTLICIGFLVRYYRNEIQRLVDYSTKLENHWKDSFENWNESISEVILRGNKILELINSMNILKNQNKRYSKICRKLYDENQNLKLENQGIESLFIDMKNKANEFELKIAELEKNKLKKRKKI